MSQSCSSTVELFAGAGLFGYAFKAAGFRIQHAVEIDRAAARTYAANVSSHVEASDVRTVRPSGRAAVLLATPPCQAYSSLHRGRATEGEQRRELCMEVVRWAAVVRPRIVVVENVPAFLKSPHCDRMVAGLEALGFETAAKTVNARGFGVPQNRVRGFVFASKVGIPDLDAFAQPGERTAGEALEGLPLRPDGANNHAAPVPTPLCLERIRAVPPGGDVRDIYRTRPELVPPSWPRTGGKIVDIWGRIAAERPSNTVKTEFQHPSRGRFVHPVEDRVISLREAARLQSVPDAFRFHGYSVEISRQIGNAVPFLLGGAVARAVRELLV